MKAVIQLHRGEVMVDLSRPISLSLPVDFSGGGPRHFGAPAAASQPFVAPGFSGAVTTGASCEMEFSLLTFLYQSAQLSRARRLEALRDI